MCIRDSTQSKGGWTDCSSWNGFWKGTGKGWLFAFLIWSSRCLPFWFPNKGSEMGNYAITLSSCPWVDRLQTGWGKFLVRTTFGGHRMELSSGCQCDVCTVRAPTTRRAAVLLQFEVCRSRNEGGVGQQRMANLVGLEKCEWVNRVQLWHIFTLVSHVKQWHIFTLFLHEKICHGRCANSVPTKM